MAHPNNTSTYSFDSNMSGFSNNYSFINRSQKGAAEKPGSMATMEKLDEDGSRSSSDDDDDDDSRRGDGEKNGGGGGGGGGGAVLDVNEAEALANIMSNGDGNDDDDRGYNREDSFQSRGNMSYFSKGVSVRFSNLYGNGAVTVAGEMGKCACCREIFHRTCGRCCSPRAFRNPKCKWAALGFVTIAILAGAGVGAYLGISSKNKGDEGDGAAGGGSDNNSGDGTTARVDGVGNPNENPFVREICSPEHIATQKGMDTCRHACRLVECCFTTIAADNCYMDKFDMCTGDEGAPCAVAYRDNDAAPLNIPDPPVNLDELCAPQRLDDGEKEFHDCESACLPSRCCFVQDQPRSDSLTDGGKDDIGTDHTESDMVSCRDQHKDQCAKYDSACKLVHDFLVNPPQAQNVVPDANPEGVFSTNDDLFQDSVEFDPQSDDDLGMKSNTTENNSTIPAATSAPGGNEGPTDGATETPQAAPSTTVVADNAEEPIIPLVDRVCANESISTTLGREECLVVCAKRPCCFTADPTFSCAGESWCVEYKSCESADITFTEDETMTLLGNLTDVCSQESLEDDADGPWNCDKACELRACCDDGTEGSGGSSCEGEDPGFCNDYGSFCNNTASSSGDDSSTEVPTTNATLTNTTVEGDGTVAATNETSAVDTASQEGGGGERQRSRLRYGAR